jgi:hypothetical protein
LQIHCAVALTHVQRIEAVERLAGLTGKHGLTRVWGHVAGTEAPRVRTSGDGDTLSDSIREQVVAASLPHMIPPVGRLRYQYELARHQSGFAPTGFGEVTFRHAEAWRAGSALVCQDLSHVEMMLPMRDRENVVFCRPDLTDLRRTVEELLADEDTRRQVARTGRRVFSRWWRDWRENIYFGIEAHVRDVLRLGFESDENAGFRQRL